MSDPGSKGSLPVRLDRESLDLLPAAAYVCDAEGVIRYYNAPAVELWGRRPELGRDMWCGSHRILERDGSLLPLDQCPMAVTIKQGEGVRGAEIVVERPDGVRRRVMPHPVPLRDESGHLLGGLNLLVDITGREESDEQVRASEARLQAILTATPECVKLIARDGTLLEMNPAGLRMVEADRAEQVVGRSVYELIAPEAREAYRAFNERICRGESGSLEFDLIGLLGTRRSLETHAVPVPDAKGRLMHLAVTRDVTEQKRVGKEAKRAVMLKEWLAAIVESSDDAIVSKTLDGVISTWNQGAEKIFGYTAEEVTGKHISVIIPPEQDDDVALILDRIRRGERVDHYHTKRRTKDGRILDVSLTVSPVRDATGQVIGASKVARDITAQKLAEVRLRESEERLQEADRRKNEFLAMLAHELRNPLSAISNAVVLTQQSELTDTLRWSMKVIERQVKQLALLIEDLLDVARITRGKIQLRKDIVDVAPILAGAVETVRPLIEERKHKLDVCLGPGTMRVEADPVRLEQIAVNLLTNAAKYTDSGGCIRLSAEQEGGELVVRVRDNGIGIPPENIPAMFELFVQGDRSAARSEGGLGIGLTLVKTLAEMQGGSVSAESAGPGTGSEFTLRLPAVASPRTAPAMATTGNRATMASSRILVVDDNADSARGLSRLLKLLGHAVRTVHDGPSAVAAAESFQPDIVLLDIGLPGMDGYEVARELRTHQVCKNLVIIAVSGYGQDDDRRRSREAGFDFHLVKPIDHNDLLTLLSTQ